MPTTSGRLGLLAPVGADFPSEYRLSIAQHAALLGNAALAPNVRVITTSETIVSPGDVALVSPNVTVTLATAGGDTQLIEIIADKTTTATTPVTVASSSSQPIYGPGMTTGPTTFVLGAGLASVSLVSLTDGWLFIAGTKQDTGWVPLTLTGGSAFGSGYTPACRLIGDRVWLRGAVTSPSGTIATLPAGLRPSVPQVWLVAGGVGGVGAAADLEITSGGAIATASTFAISFDGLSFSI